MAKILTGAEFAALFPAVKHEAFRLELQPAYREPNEQRCLTAWLAGHQTDPLMDMPGAQEWFAMVAALTRRGGRMERVRVHEEPPTDYQRWLQWLGAWNTEAGEVLRYLTRRRAQQIGLLPAAGDVDWWLLDDRTLVQMRFDTHGNRIHTELETRRAALEQARRWRDLALKHGMPLTVDRSMA